MHGSLFLPLLSLLLSALPAVLCVDDTQGTPTLIFESHFGDAKSPLLASVEVERLTNIKGNRSEIVGVLGVGYTVAPAVSKDATTGVDYLEFFPPASPPTLPNGVCGVKPGFGGGEVVYYPFRLDHNTVFNNKAQPVEDNGWIFSWRAAWGALRTQTCAPGGPKNLLYANADVSHETIYDQLNNAWQVVYSFPTAANVNNLIVAQRTRAPVTGADGLVTTPIELGVFISSDPTGTQGQTYNYLGLTPATAYPVAVFPIPEAKVANNQWRSYVLYIPMPDRSPVFKVVGSFYSSTGDYPGIVTAGYAPADWTSAATDGAKKALKTIFQRQIETQWAIWENAFVPNGATVNDVLPPVEGATVPATSNRVAWTFVDSAAVLPTTGLGSHSFTFEIRRGANHPHLDNFIRHFVKSYSAWLKTQFSTAPYTWDTVSVNYRAKGALKAKDITMWFDGQRVEQTMYQMVPPKNLMNWLRVATTDPARDAWSQLWTGTDSIFNQVFGAGTGDAQLVTPIAGATRAFEFEQPATTAKVSLINHEPSGSYAFFFSISRVVGDCTANTDFTAPLAAALANAGRRFHERMDNWGVAPAVYPTSAYGFTGVVTDDAYLGFTSPSHFDVKQRYTTAPGCLLHVSIRIRDPEDGLGGFMVLNSDVDTGFTAKRQAPVVATPFTGPFFVIGAHPTSFNAKPDVGPEDYKGIVQNLRLADVRIYTTAATNAAKSVTESFLKTLVECGDGQLDSAEACDKSDRSCTGDCTCPLRTVPKAPKGCTYCGNGVIDYLLGEVCDVFEDPWCASNCTACSQVGMVVDEVQLPSNGVVTQVKGRCSFCGNGKLDINNGEICDKKDPNCNADCKGCKAGWFATGNSVGSCFRCGNKVLDAGEVCDIGFNPHVCASDCSSCRAGFIPDGAGSCTACGNGVVDAGEACDKALSACKSDCSACVEFHVPSSKGCTRCGNGRLDAGEMCDAAQPNCKSDCSGCTNSRVPSEDALGTCSLCGNGRMDANGDLGLPEACDADPNCLGCNDCRTPYVLSKQGGTCVLCGNGRLDAGEVCDASQMGCDSSCSSCGEDWMSLADADANPTGLCFPTTCSEATGADGECTCQ